MRKTARFAAMALLAALCASPADAAGGAFAVDDAAVESAGVCKVEAIATLGVASNSDRSAISTPACAIALAAHRAEVAVSFGRRRTAETYATPALVKFKTPLPGLDFSADEKFGVALSAGYFTNLAGDRRGGYFVTLPLSYRLNDTLLFNINIGRNEFEHPGESFTAWGASVEINLKAIGYAQITLVAETFAPARAETAYQLGARYAASAALDLDLLFGGNLGGERKSWLTLGVTQRF